MIVWCTTVLEVAFRVENGGILHWIVAKLSASSNLREVCAIRAQCCPVCTIPVAEITIIMCCFLMVELWDTAPPPWGTPGCGNGFWEVIACRSALFLDDFFLFVFFSLKHADLQGVINHKSFGISTLSSKQWSGGKLSLKARLITQSNLIRNL